MADDVIQPFNADMKEHGRYQYTGTNRKSSLVASRRLSDVIRDSLTWEGRTVVDLGCGDGTYTATLRDETPAASILGIDPAAEAIDYACKTYLPSRPNLTYRAGFARDLLAEGQQFDIGIFRGVIHHVADPAAEIRDGLALAQTIFIMEPNGWNPILKLLERFSPYHVQHKEQSYRLGQLKRWIEDGGGEVVSVHIFCLVPFFCPGWMVTMGSALEPLVERIPLFRMIACGQTGIVARRKTKEGQSGVVGMKMEALK